MSHPGKFISSSTLAPIAGGPDIQSTFFDMWLQDHPDVALEEVPGDWATSSASGLDPHITLQNAYFQLDRISKKWALNQKRDPATVRNEIEKMLLERATAPWGGLAGERIVNVLEINLALRAKYGAPS